MEFKVESKPKIKVVWEEKGLSFQISRPTMLQVEEYEKRSTDSKDEAKTSLALDFIYSLSEPGDREAWTNMVRSWDVDTTLSFIEFVLGRKKS